MYDELDLLSLGAPAGNGQENDPDDIAALDGALRRINAYTPPPEYADGPQRYATEPMINALTVYQEQNGLKSDGYANPGGPTERAINNRLLAKPRGTGLLFDPPGQLAGTVGNGFRNERPDVATVQRMLGALDYMPEDPYDRPPGFIDERTTAATRRFQRDKGLEPDGWLAPGGETETALHNSVSDLARDKVRDWFAFVERARKAQAKMLDKIAYRSPPGVEPPPAGNDGTDADDGDAAIIPVMRDRWYDQYPGGRQLPWGPNAPGYGRIGIPRAAAEPRTKPLKTIELLPPLGFIAGTLGLLEEPNDKDGSKAEYIPPHVPNEPHRGPDPTKPPLQPNEMRPAPSPSEPPPNMPDRNENIPPRIDPRDFILITPDQSEAWAKYIFIERRGNEKTRAGLQVIADAARNVASNRPDVEIRHIGGSRNEKGREVEEYYAPNRDRAARSEDSRKGASYGDITLEVDKKIIHISFYRANADGSPKAIEIDQAQRLAYNTRAPNVVIMIQNRYGKEAIDQKAVERFIGSVVDAVRAGAGDGYLNVRDPRVRESIIRYFDAYKPK